MADPPLSDAAPRLRTPGRARLAGVLAAVLIHLLPIALLSHCFGAVRDEPAPLTPMQVRLHDRPARASAPARFDIRPPTPSSDIAPPELQVQTEAQTIPASAPSVPGPTSPRVASARDCWPYRWLLRMSRTIDSALRYPTDARRGGARGTVYVRVSIERSGQVLEAPVIRSSGHPRLDDEARAVLQRIGRFEPLEPGDCIGYDVIVVDQPVRFGH